MNVRINANRLRPTLPDVVERVQKGTRFTVIYRSRPAFQIVPVDDKGSAPISLADDTLYRAQPVGSSDDGRTSIDHDTIVYQRRTSCSSTRVLDGLCGPERSRESGLHGCS